MATRMIQMATELKRAVQEVLMWRCASIVMQSVALVGIVWARTPDTNEPAVWTWVAWAVGLGLLAIAETRARRLRRAQKKLDELVSLSRPRR